MLEAALEYCSRGWSVFPLRDKHRPYLSWKEFQTRRPTPAEVSKWWTDYPDAWIGVALGQISGIVRIDADGAAAIQELDRLGGLGETLTFRTASGGVGWLLKHFEGANTEVLWTGTGDHEELRVQSTGAYTVLPPSPGYAWLNTAPIASIPRWLYDIYAAKVLNTLTKELRPTIRQPDRTEVLCALQHIKADDYDRWVQVGMALKSAGDEYLVHWRDWSKTSHKYQEGICESKWATFSDNGLTLRSILYWAESEGNWSPPGRHEPLTELGNARVLARIGEGKILHSDRWGWLQFDGKRWDRENAEKVTVELQKQVLKYRLDKAVESLQLLKEDDPDLPRKRKSKIELIRAIRRHEEEKRIRGMRELAKSEPLLSIDYRKFDVDTWLLNCYNGILDLRSGELMEHGPHHLITQLCPTPFDAAAQCPRFERFIAEVLVDGPLIDWMQKFLGYCLTGTTSAHILPIFFGSGANGKSTLIKTLIHVLGADYAGTTPSEFLVQTKGEQHPTKLVALYGRRLLADLETGDGAKLNEELVKRLTGGDELQARRMHENFWSFKPTHKLILCTNYEPKVKGVDAAIWRRLRLIPFNVSFEGREDPTLDVALQSEAPGILRWMFEGCIRWQREGLGEVSAVIDATTSYRSTQDTVVQFYNERIERAEGNRIRRAEVAGAYKGWCYSSNVEPVSPAVLLSALDKLGVKLDPTGKFFLDIRL